MDNQEIQRRVQEALRRSEVNAVLQIIRNGRRPMIGETVDYHVDLFASAARGQRRTSYRVNVEEWHLAEADRLIGKL